MFGYVNAYKDLLRVCDYNTFRGYYCGLCKQLGKSFNQFVRFGLSYDMVFLAIIVSSLSDETGNMKMQSCIAHPVTKRYVLYDDCGIKYASDMSILLTYLKLRDDWEDEKSIKSFARLFYYLPNRRIIKKYKSKYDIICNYMNKLRQAEMENCKNPDLVADCFGNILQNVFDIDGNNKALLWLGYHIGRFIYLVDAYNDIDNDLKNKSYNPFVALYGENLDKNALKEAVSGSLTYTLNEISSAYSLLDIKKNKEILDNIIYLGLRQNIDKL